MYFGYLIEPRLWPFLEDFVCVCVCVGGGGGGIYFLIKTKRKEKTQSPVSGIIFFLCNSNTMLGLPYYKGWIHTATIPQPSARGKPSDWERPSLKWLINLISSNVILVIRKITAKLANKFIEL